MIDRATAVQVQARASLLTVNLARRDCPPQALYHINRHNTDAILGALRGGSDD